MHQTFNSALWMNRRSRCALLLGVSACLGGCGPGAYLIEIGRAEQRLGEARAANAERLATYEYYYAKEHFEKARREAAEADYGDALELAETSFNYATLAIERAAGRGPQ